MKEHERIFFALCYNLRNGLKPRDVVHILAETIPHKRCWYYLQKWSGLGFYDYGITLDLGWFYPGRLPDKYLQIVQGCEPLEIIKQQSPQMKALERLLRGGAGNE